MPNFLRCAGDLRLIAGVSENEAVFIAVFLQPEVHVIGRSVDVHRKTKLMLAVSRYCDPLLRHLLCLALRVTLSTIFSDLVVVKTLLLFLRSIA
jgi:hypothetical protein